MKKFTFGEWLRVWYETYKVPYLKPYSLRNIEQMIRLHTPEWLKVKRMVSVSAFDIDRALAEIPRGRTRVYARQVWYSAFRKAFQLGIVDRNVLEQTDSVRYRKISGKALTISEQQDFLNAIQGSRYQWLMLFYLHSGVRRMEALTLLWSDIDEKENLILIRGTKTEGSFRYIFLTDDLKVILKEQRKQVDRREPRVFPFVAQTVSKAFKAFCPKHHLHDLRHTYITRCAECGMSVKVCQQLVGHASADMTLNVYMHVLDGYKRKEAQKFTLFPDFDTT